MIHTIQVILIHSMYIPTTLAAADAKHWKTLNRIYFDELQLMAYIGAVGCGTGGFWWLSYCVSGIIGKWQCCTWDFMS